LADLVVLGTGELGRLARRNFETDSAYRVVAFTMDRAFMGDDNSFEGLPLVPFDELVSTHPPSETDLFIAIGYRRVNRARAEAYGRARAAGYRLASYVSTRALVEPDLELGDNCFVFEGVIIQPFVRIGANTIIWSGACVAHDTIVGSHCFIAPRASISGNVSIDDFVFVGNNATVRDGVSIGMATVIGAGALVKHDTKPGSVYAPPASEASTSKRSEDLDNL
jgi:sugar O-acyltransferase (sialic acid O-acetyltransferase NeuD family)